jgi:Family of unknown function (DUF6183)
MVTRTSFVASLDNVSDVNVHYAYIDRHARQGDRAALKEIFAELSEAKPRSRIPDWALGAVLERIIEALAMTDGYDNAITALDLAAVAAARAKGSSVRLRPPAVASKIVAAHSPDVLERLLRKVTDLETTALVLHEAVVRGKLSAESPVGRETQDRLATAKHPLALMPLTLLDLEQGVLLPNYGLGSSGTSIPFGPTREQTAAAPAPLSGSLEAAESTCPERANLISAAVINWKDESNGQIEARTFRVSAPSRYSLAAIIPRLGLESLGTTGDLHLRENAAVKDVFTVLFSAASSGGAYNCGNFAAYGRLLAWRSLAGLVGALADAPVPDIATSSQDCQWCLFDSPSDWYHQVAWDIGIACFNPAHREVAVLAATDTD